MYKGGIFEFCKGQLQPYDHEYIGVFRERKRERALFLMAQVSKINDLCLRQSLLCFASTPFTFYLASDRS